MVNSWVWRIFWNYKIFWNYNCWNILIDDWAFQVALVVKIPPATAGDLRDTGSIPCLERSLGGGHMENPMDRRAWWATVIPLHTVRHNWGDLACTHSFYCASLYYICVYIYIYLQIEVLWQLCIKKIYQYHFSKSHFLTLSFCHLLVILTMFQTFSLFYLSWWSVISNLWCCYYNYLGTPWTTPI